MDRRDFDCSCWMICVLDGFMDRKIFDCSFWMICVWDGFMDRRIFDCSRWMICVWDGFMDRRIFDCRLWMICVWEGFMDRRTEPQDSSSLLPIKTVYFVHWMTFREKYGSVDRRLIFEEAVYLS